jgi:HEPN domain-containing protein
MPVREEVVSWLEEGKADLRHARRSLQIGDYN